MVVEWCQLPGELLEEVAKRLGDSEIDLLRFRSVCSTWRSSVSPQPHPHRHLTSSATLSRFPILPNDGISETTCWAFYLSKRTIFCLGLPEPCSQSSGGWLIKLECDFPHRLHLLNPLSRSAYAPLPPDFPKHLDFFHLRVSELAHEYTLQYISYRPFANSIGDAGNLYMEKVALSPMPCGGFMLLTIHVSGKLVMFKSGDKRWTVIDDLPSPYDDVIFYRDQFYAVDNTGRTVLVAVPVPVPVAGPGCPTVSVVANPVFGGDKKFLVESCGELLLVDMYLSVGTEDDFGYYDEGSEFYEEFDCFMTERTVRFKVFQLDKIGQTWVEVQNLGDRILFLGDNCTFSASASAFSGCRGNCILFMDQFFCAGREEDGGLKSRGIGVFDLESGSIGPLASYQDYAKLFWPPPAWLSPTFRIEDGLNQLRL